MPKMLKICTAILAAGYLATIHAQGTTEKKPAAGATEKKQAPAASTTEKKPAQAAHAAGKHVFLPAGEQKWGPAPPGLPAGAQMVVLDGDPGKAGVPFALMVKLPDGYKVPPHWHPTTENLVVLSGTLMVGTGDEMNESAAQALTAGGYAKMPARMHHFAMAKGETVFQSHGVGPFGINYVNPSDDPRKKTTTQ